MALEGLDDHIIGKFGDHKMLLRPAASRRLSFRGTPDGILTIRAGATKGPGLGDTEEPVDDPRVRGRFGGVLAPMAPHATPSVATTGRPASPQSTAQDRDLLSSAMLASSLGTRAGSTGGQDAVPLAADNSFGRPPRLSMDDFGNIVVVPEDPPPLPPRPRPPVEVTVAVRDGAELASGTLQETFPQLGRLTAGPFPGHDVIDVTFTNPNDLPVTVLAFLHVQNDLEISTTTLSETFLTRVLRNTVLWFAPTFGIRDGKLRFAFSEEAMGPLGLEAVATDVGLDVDVRVDIEPVDFDLVTHEDAVRAVAEMLVDDIRSAIPLVPGGVSLPEDLVEQIVDAFFSQTRSPSLLFQDLDLPAFLWGPALDRHPMLAGHPSLAGSRDDVALDFHLRITEIWVGASVLTVEVDTVTARLLAVLRSGSRPVPHPVGSLRDDFVRAGFLVPRFDLSVDVGGIDVDLDLPGGIVTKPFEFLAEEALEEVADWFKDDFERMAVDLGMEYLEEASLKVGEFATAAMNLVADRDHVFRSLRSVPGGWVVETLDPAQLAVPFVPPDPVDHRFDDINVNLGAVEPVDGPMPVDATQRLGRVDHLVFLMMENRSFDHMLGYLSHPSHTGRPDVDGLDGRSISLGGDFVGTSATPQPGPRDSFAPDPGHGVETVAAQVNGGAMDGFVSEFVHRMEGTDEVHPQGNLMDPERILRFHTPAQVHVYDDLTRTDMVLDRWFCSVPGPTYPNRFCYYTGITPHLSNLEIFEDIGYQQQLTFLDILDHEGVDWVCYESDFTFLRVFEPYRRDTTRIRPFEEFLSRQNALPPVTLLDPDFTGPPSGGPPNDDHPPSRVADGQHFIEQVIDKLQDLSSWPRTMLVITYDEHGGFADHVPPPGAPGSEVPPGPDGQLTVPVAHPDLTHYGVRVPAFVVSPVATAGAAGHRVYDHATMFRTVIERFTPRLRDSAIIPERVRRARHLGELVEPGPTDTSGVPRVQVALAADTPGVDAHVHHVSDDHRPHLAPPPSRDDFELLIRRFGNPIPPP